MNKFLSIMVSCCLSALTHATDPEMLDPEFMEFFAAVYQDPTETAQLKLEQLEEKLGIQENQISAWNNFKQMIISNMERKQEHQQTVQEQLKGRLRTISAPDMLEIHLQNLAFKRDEAENALATLRPLYDVLSEDQQVALSRVLKMLWYKERRN